jgi:hypothetical protein
VRNIYFLFDFIMGGLLSCCAVYEKQIGSNGQTIQNTKTVYTPGGGIDTVKEKMPGGKVFRVSGRIDSQRLSKQLD